jgi:hypothetical protein
MLHKGIQPSNVVMTKYLGSKVSVVHMHSIAILVLNFLSSSHMPRVREAPCLEFFCMVWYFLRFN